MEIGEFRGFSAGGSSTTMDRGSEGRPTQLVDGGTMSLEEKRSPSLEFSNIQANSSPCNTVAGISLNFVSAKLLKIRDCNSLEQEEAQSVVTPKLQDQLSFDNEMVGVACDTRNVLDTHCDADNVSEVGHLENGTDEMHVEGDGVVPLSS